MEYFDPHLMDDVLEKQRNIAKSRRKKAIIEELTGEPAKEHNKITVMPNSLPENVITDVIELEERKRSIESNALKTIDRSLQTKQATCNTCGGSGKTPGKKFIGYKDMDIKDKLGKVVGSEQRPDYEPVELVCNTCFGEGLITRKNSERITSMVASRHFPKTSVNLNVNIDTMGRDGLINFIQNA